MIMLAYDTSTLILPNPQYPEALTVGVKTKFEHAMDGKIYSTKYTPASRIFDLAIKGIMGNKKDEVIIFLKASAGQVIIYTDEQTINHNVKLISESIEFTYVGKGYNGMYAYDFNLMLEKVQ